MQINQKCQILLMREYAELVPHRTVRGSLVPIKTDKKHHQASVKPAFLEKSPVLPEIRSQNPPVLRGDLSANYQIKPAVFKIF
jgi:hypothetical protein